MSAWARRGILTLCYPVDYGVVKNWDDWEKMLHELFYNSLRQAPEEHPTCLISAPHSPKADLEKMTQIMFETFNVPALVLVPSDVAALTAVSAYRGADMMSGMVVNIGGSTVVSCVYNGTPVRESAIVRKFGAKELANELHRLLEESGHTLPVELREEIKTKLCFCAPYDPELFEQQCAEQPELVAKTIPPSDHNPEPVVLSHHLWKPAELLFTGDESLPNLIIQSLSQCPSYVRDSMTSIVLSGGTTQLPGLADRIKKTTGMMVHAVPQRAELPWVGGSYIMNELAKTGWGSPCLISKEKYDEIGPTICHEPSLFPCLPTSHFG